MSTWTVITGRILTLVSIATLTVFAFADGPAWSVAASAIAGGVGLLLMLPTRPVSKGTELGSILAATSELERIAGAPPPRLNTDPSLKGRLEDAAARITEATSRISVSLDSADDVHRSVASLLDSVDEPVLATDRHGRVFMCNAAARKLLGLRPDKLMGRPIEEVFIEGEIARIIGAAAQGQATQEEVRVQRAEGPRTWEVSAKPYGSPDGSPGRHAVALSLRDASDRAIAFQVKTDFVANASHELRTPISAIRAAVETLEALGPEDREMQERVLAMLGAHTQRLEDLIRDLLDLSKLESPESPVKFSPVPGSELPHALAPMFEIVCRDRNVSLRFDLSPELERLRTDRNLLLLILSNLIDNACKFAFEGTEVIVSGRPADDGQGVRIEVTDRGVGIPLGQQQRIFERFFQVDPARTGGPRRGTGLGLSIVKHAVRRLGGTIRVNSVWQQGTTMIVELPNCLEPRTVQRAIGR